MSGFVELASARRGLGSKDCKFSSDRAANFPGPVKKVVINAAAGYLKIRGDAAGGVKATGRACASSESAARQDRAGKPS